MSYLDTTIPAKNGDLYIEMRPSYLKQWIDSDILKKKLDVQS